MNEQYGFKKNKFLKESAWKGEKGWLEGGQSASLKRQWPEVTSEKI